MHTTAQVDDMFKTLMRQKIRNLHTAPAVMANANDRGVRLQFMKADWHCLHRHQLRSGDMTGLVFPWFPYIE